MTTRARERQLNLRFLCCAEALSGAELDGLTGPQHRALLSFLCNDVLEGERLREVLQVRLEDSGEVKREMRGAVAEKKGELKV